MALLLQNTEPLSLHLGSRMLAVYAVSQGTLSQSEHLQ